MCVYNRVIIRACVRGIIYIYRGILWIVNLASHVWAVDCLAQELFVLVSLKDEREIYSKIQELD